MNLKLYDGGGIGAQSTKGTGILVMDDTDQRELLVFIKNNRPALLHEIMCEDCPEHQEYHNYCVNTTERK